jgi:exosortase family protein XrtF
LKEYLLQYKSFLLFLVKFFVTYLVLSFVYQSYLNRFDQKNNQVDTFTVSVANQTIAVLSVVDNQSYSMPNLNEPSVKLFYKNKWVARIIEGCNALSVMILFVSFIIAFSGKFKTMLLFILSGIVIIHIFNVLRIALLSMAVFHYPEYQDFLHSVIFPLFIYGVVFVLWVIWVNNYSSYAKK